MSAGDRESDPPSSESSTGGAAHIDHEIDALFDDFDQLLKNPEVGALLTERGVNVSLAIIAADGLRALLKGDKERAVEEFSTTAEEISGRMRLARASDDTN